ncbi:MAG: histidine kinase [Dehalococcoidia bacterium]|nr:histidine kinase [Dehalococcoidia bacterium]
MASKPDRELTEAKRLEKVLMFQRWLYVPAVLFAAFLYDWLYPPSIAAVVCLLILANIAARYFYRRDISPRQQSLLSLGLLAVDILAAFWVIILGIRHGHTALYIIFAPMIVEAAIRFGLKGSLIADVLFSLVFLGIRQYGMAFWDVPYPLADYILTVGVMSFVSLMVGMVVRQWRHHRHQAEQLAAERALLLERRRISNELHDSVLKSLEGLALETHAIRQQQSSEATPLPNEQSRYVENVCRQVSREIRDVIFEMREETTSKNIIEHIYKLADAWQREGRAELTFVHSDGIPELPWRLAHNILKVLEEALLNIQRHAHASQVKLALDAADGILKIVICDNGCGFNADLRDIYTFARQGRLGLISMKERVEMSGGRFSVESSPGGTMLTAHIPITDSGKQTD